MLKNLMSIFDWLFATWNKMPPSAREKIVVAIVDALEEKFRNMFRYEKKTSVDPERAPTEETNFPAEQENFEKALVPVVRTAAPALTDKETRTLISSIFNLLFSDDFFKDFLKKTGVPAANETEDHYVDRAKIVLTSMLNSKLRK
jgi:hypothetical protein